MLIVLTIIGILAGIYLLTAGPAVERARASSCASDRATIRREYYLLRAAGGFTSSDFASAVKNELGRSGISGDGTTFGNVCCDGGTYTCKTDENGTMSIYCSVHDAPPATTISVGRLTAFAKRKFSLMMSSIRGR
jgi:type II secretory pathway pseudopilin PulG